MKLFQKKIPTKTREEIVKEIDDIFAGRDHSERGKLILRTSIPLKALMGEEKVKAMFVEEYIKKYGELKTGKKSVETMKKESEAELKKFDTGNSL